MQPIDKLVHKIRSIVQITELALKGERVQARNPLAADVRSFLIRQLWWADRVLALMRDGQDFTEAFDRMERNVQAARVAIGLLRDGDNRS